MTGNRPWNTDYRKDTKSGNSIEYTDRDQGSKERIQKSSEKTKLRKDKKMDLEVFQANSNELI